MMFLNLCLSFKLFIILISLAPSIHCYFVNVDAHAEECFFDKVTAGTKMGLTFEVAEGGFLDIDVKVWKYYFLIFVQYFQRQY